MLISNSSGHRLELIFYIVEGMGEAGDGVLLYCCVIFPIGEGLGVVGLGLFGCWIL